MQRGEGEEVQCWYQVVAWKTQEGESEEDTDWNELGEGARTYPEDLERAG